MTSIGTQFGSKDYGETIDSGSEQFNYSLKLHEYTEALSPYGVIETTPPNPSIITIDDFTSGTHFRTGTEIDNSLQLELENRLLTFILDTSGSMTWNDSNGDRYAYLKKLLSKLSHTYPGDITTNLITFGGSLAKTTLFIAPSGADLLLDDNQSFERLLQSSFQDSVYDFAGVRVVRRSDRFPVHPADGVVVSDGIMESVKDEGLTEGRTYYYGIWTFNKNRHYSPYGQFVSGVPRDRILPHGVNFANATVRILPGVLRSTDAALIYNFVEGGGSIVFDSSGNGMHGIVGSEMVESSFWSGSASSSTNSTRYKPVGVNFDGEYDIIETNIGDDAGFIPNSDFITISFWVKPKFRITTQWMIGTSTNTPTNNIGWMVGVNADGNLVWQMGDIDSGVFGFLAGADPVLIPENEWTMVTLRWGAFSSDSGYIFLYINGQETTTTSKTTPVVQTGMDRLYIGGKPVSSGSDWEGSDFFGSISNISIHSVDMGSDWIADTYNTERPIFYQTYLPTQSSIDNSQREVLINWEISTDYDYENGSVKIVKKYNSLPANDEDGILVATIDASPGEYFYLDTGEFIHGGNYYYRIFTINSMGNVCDREQARSVALQVPYSPVLSSPASLPTVSNESVVSGNKKLLLQWTNPVGDNWYGTKVFYSGTQFPTVSVGKNGITSSGVEIADTTKSFYTHRVVGVKGGGSIPLTNGILHYYTIVTYDLYGRLSERVFVQGVPSSSSENIFDSDEVKDVHLTVINPTTLSVGWSNPTLSTERLQLYFGESAVVFVGVRDIFGGTLNNLDNMKLEVCSSFETNSIIANKESLSNDRGPEPNIDSLGNSGSTWPSTCFLPAEAEGETILNYATVGSGLIKGILTHTLQRDILARRKTYNMSVRARYSVTDPDDSDKVLFEYVSPSSSVEFQHPMKLALINKLNKKASVTPGADGKIRGLEACQCPKEDEDPVPQTRSFDGGYIGASKPYVVRCEVQYKGEALPEGTPVNVSLWSHKETADSDFLRIKSNKTAVREGSYATKTVFDQQLDPEGTPTGEVVSKSVIEIEVPHPSEPDWVDLQVSIDYLGFVIDGIHTIRFVGTLFISANISNPNDNGIDVAEQFATVWILNPDFPQDMSKAIPAPDGTKVKWELIKGQYGKERPFYSTEELPNIISGVYSSTRNGVARNVFFGPVGNIEAHEIVKQCGEGNPPEECCVGEEYTIKASVVLGDQTSFDGLVFNYSCNTRKFTDKRFFVNAASNQPGSYPHWITWADGESLLKFQIAANPVEVEANEELDIPNIEQFNNCVENIVGGQNFSLPVGHIVQITAPGEILWNVEFDEDPYTGELVPSSYDSITPEVAENLGIPHVANIPIAGDITDFYIRYNTFVGSANPKPTECSSLGDDVDLLDCQYRNLCSADQTDIGNRWDNVGTLTGTTTIIVDNKTVTLHGGGDYEDGIFPVKIGFKEPLDVRIVEARDPSGAILRELPVDGTTRITFVCEVKFANSLVPDGTPIELNISGTGSEIVILSNCATSPVGCNPASNGIIYTRQINDFRLNPEGPKRSLAFFTIEPISNVTFDARIETVCRYDKLGTVDRKITKCIKIQNTANVTPGDYEIPEDNEEAVATQERVTSNESIVYNTVQDLYESSRASQIGRIGHFMVSSSFSTIDEIYIMGGYTGLGTDLSNDGDLSTANITPYCEVFNSLSQEWSFIANMPTARCCGSAVTVENRIYCIGGVEKEVGPVDRYVVSRKIEAYDIRLGIWIDTLAPLPEGYGIAFGDAQEYNGYIYVTCGITTLVGDSQPGDLNNRILRYSIAADEWEIIIPSDTVKYSRLAPMGFLRTNARDYHEVAYNISASNNDGIGWSSTFDSSGSTLIVGDVAGTNYSTYLRFQIDLPADAVLTEARLFAVPINLHGDSQNLPDITVSILNMDDYSDFDLSDPHSEVDWSPSATEWILSALYSEILSPDISDIMATWVARPGYLSGNHIVIKLSSPAAAFGFSAEFSSFDSLLETFQLRLTYYSPDSSNKYYIYSGSIPRLQSEIESERVNRVNNLLSQFRSFILTSPYYTNLTPSAQEAFVKSEEKRIRDSVAINPFTYLADGFIFTPGSEAYDSEDQLLINISTNIEDEWPVLPVPRDRGKAVYIPFQDTVYFIGGANLNKSTTLNKMESVDLFNDFYSSLTSLNRGRALFGAVNIGNDIYLAGGLTSGHRPGWSQIEVIQSPGHMLATGVESSGILIRLVNDSGELIDADVRVDIRGRLRIPEIDDLLSEYIANRVADRALGGDGSGNATDLPVEGESVDIGRIIEAQNTIINPNSDQFQWNASRKLGQEVTLFPVLYSSNQITLHGGVGSVVLKPRSEDPFQDVAKLSEFIQQQLDNTPQNPDERFEGDLTRDELAALGEVLSTITLPPTIIESGLLRNLYQIETVVTVLDDFYFGQTISDFDLKVQDSIRSRIEDLLTPPVESGNKTTTATSYSVPGISRSGQSSNESECLTLEHSAQPDIPPQNYGGSRNSGPGSRNQPGGPGASGQCLFCDTIIPLKPDRKEQNFNSYVQVYNYFDWVPQVRDMAITNLTTPDELLDMVDLIDHETPFGGSQLYDALFRTGRIMSDDDFSLVKKCIYICSDNSENLSLTSRREAVEEINSIDGDLQVPIIYTVFSTSFPSSVSAMLQRADNGDVAKLTEDTGGQSTTLLATKFLDSILNLTLGAAVGGLGYGIYRRTVIFDELTSITSMVTNFYLPQNTQGFVRFRHSQDGFNFSDFTERFEGSGLTDFTDFFARVIEFEVVLTTGFTENASEEYAATGIPRLLSIVLNTSGEREDFIFLNKETVLTNAQQVAVAFEGTIPASAIVDIGACPSTSHDWRDFSSPAQPSVRESGKIFLLDRTNTEESIVPPEPLVTKDQKVYTSTYGPWNPDAVVRIYKETSTDDVEVLSGFNLYPRDGRVIFSTRQNPATTYKLSIVNDNQLRIGIRLRNRLHTDSISMEGVGYIYSTNDEKPPELSQVAPRATNVSISPTVPNATDTIFAIYTYVDLNNDKESGTIISWFKNNKQLLEIQNRTSWHNDDLLTGNRLVPNDRIYYTVSPSDGRDFGSTVISPSIVVAAQEPGVSGLRLIPRRNNVVNARYDTSSSITLEYNFETDDEGSASLQSGTIVRWFLNSVLFKEGTFTEIVSPTLTPEQLQQLRDRNTFATVLKPEEIIAGVSAHEIGNQVYVEVTPKTLLTTGATVRSSIITIENSLPIITNVSVAPEFPTTQSSLVLSYTVDDIDILKGIQSNQTEIRWFRSINGVDYVEQSSLRDSIVVAYTLTTRGDYWKAELTPFDGLEVGITIPTNIIKIL